MKLFLLLLFFAAGTISFSQPQAYIEAKAIAQRDAVAMGCKHDQKRNIYVDDKKTIHIFLFEDGNLLLGGYPSTATEQNTYQVHLYVQSNSSALYLMEYSGNYSPVLNIEGVKVTNTKPEIKHYDFVVIGPFTGKLQLSIKKSVDGKDFAPFISTTIQIARTIHASIGGGLLYTSLKNPSNIRKVPLTGTPDSTLMADDINGRGIVTIFATFYPWVRNSLMMPGRSFKEHFGIVAGTAIGAGSNFKDLFLGVQYDFSIGGSVVGGLHYGRRQAINNIDYKDFEFGRTRYNGNLEAQKTMSWSSGFFIGIQVDSRIFGQVFPGAK